MAKRTDPDVEKRILEIHKETGRSGQAIASELGLTKSTVCRILKSNGIVAKVGRPPWLSLDHAAFDIITPESAYWMGFLCADGTIGDYGGGAPIVRLDLSTKDRSHVEKFRTFLKSGHKLLDIHHPVDHLVKTERRSVSLCVRSEQLVANLTSRGLCKYSPERAPGPEIRDSSDFWRGMIDGDGTVREHLDPRRNYTFPHIMLCGHMPVLEEFQAFLLRRGIAANIIDTTSGIFQIRLMGSGALVLIRELYANATVALDRKLDTARELLKKHSTSP